MFSTSKLWKSKMLIFSIDKNAVKYIYSLARCLNEWFCMKSLEISTKM